MSFDLIKIMSYIVKQDKIEIAPAFPVITFMTLVAMVFLYIQAQSTGFLFWAQTSCFNIIKFNQCISQKEIWITLTHLFNTTFISCNLVQLGISLYYLWTLGQKLEQFLEAKLYLLFIGLGLSLPWSLMLFETKFFDAAKYNLGPAIIIFAFFGAVLLLPSTKQFTGPMDRTKVVQRKETNILDSLKTLDNKLLLLVYIAYEAGLENYIHGQYNNIVTIQPLSGIAAFIIGVIFMSLNLAVSNEEAEHRPMRNLAKKLYKKMRGFDLDENEAILAVSKELKVPYFQVKKWISK